MRFLSEDIRKEFHLLPIDLQKSLQDEDKNFNEKGMELEILYIEDGTVSLRIQPFVDGAILEGDES